MNKKSRITYITAVAFMAAAGTVMAAETPVHPPRVYELKGLTVTANRQAEDIQSVPAHVSIVTGKEIKARNIQSAAQAVALAPGMQLEQSMEGGVSMRGYNSKSILVLVDGQRVNSGWNGEVNWNMIPVENISRIEVVRGGQSALYGGRAVGGVINIVTGTPKHDGVRGSVLESYGTYNTVRQAYNVEGKKGKVSFGAFYENRTTDGWRTFQQYASSYSSKGTQYTEGNLQSAPGKDGAGKYIIGDRGRKSLFNENYGFNVGYDFDDDRRVTYKYSHTNYNWKYGDPATYIYTKDGRPLWSGNVTMDNGDKFGFKDSSYAGTWGFRVYDTHSLTYNDQKDHIHFHFGLTDFTRDGYTSPDSALKQSNGLEGKGTRSFYPSKTWDLDFNKRWKLSSHTLLMGTAFNREKFDQTRSDIGDWKNQYASGTDTEWLGGKSQSWSVYMQDKWQINEKWTSYIGGRYDRYKKYDGYHHYAETPENNGDYGSASYGKFSPKLSLDYEYRKGTNFYVSYGQSFNPPLLYQVYRSGVPSYGSRDGRPTLANPGLKPEITTNWEFGIKKQLGEKTQVNADVFKAKTEDYIDLVSFGTANDGYKQNRNVGNADTKGFELSLTHRFSDIWSSYMNYTWQIGTVNASGTLETRNYEIPRHLFHAGVSYTNNPWTVHLDGMFVSARNEPDTFTGDYESRDPYFLLNLDSNYAITKDISLQFSIYNVLNREFYDNEALSGRTYNAAVRYSF